MHSVFELDSPSKNVSSVSAIYANDPSLFGRPSASFFAQASKPLPALESKTTTMAKAAATLKMWEETFKDDTAHYEAEPNFENHGIESLSDHDTCTWKCRYCGALFSCLQGCLPHCATKAHMGRLYWPYEYKGLPYPAQPEWDTTRSSPELAEASDSRQPWNTTPSSPASVEASEYCIEIRDPEINGRRVGPYAILTVYNTSPPSQEAAYVMICPRIVGELRERNGSLAGNLPVPVGGDAGGDSSSSHQSMHWSPWTAPSAPTDLARAQPERLINAADASNWIPTTAQPLGPGLSAGARGPDPRSDWAASSSSSDAGRTRHKRPKWRRRQWKR